MNWINFYNLIKDKSLVLSSNDLKTIFGNEISNVQLSRWVKKNLLIRLRKGKYILPENININSFILANKIFEPSYISLESALSYYNLIPDMVSAATSVTARKTRRFEFNNKLFIYQKIKKQAFVGYKQIEDFLIALPEKAVVDYFYLNRQELKNEDDWQELRINTEVYADKIKKNKLLKLSKFFNSFKLTKLIEDFDKYIRK